MEREEVDVFSGAEGQGRTLGYAGPEARSDLRQIGQALKKYAQARGGQFPPDLVSLVRTKHLAPGGLVCPASGNTEPHGPSTEAVIQKLILEPDHC
jgi:hypothetical protein